MGGSPAEGAATAQHSADDDDVATPRRKTHSLPHAKEEAAGGGGEKRAGASDDSDVVLATVERGKRNGGETSRGGRTARPHRAGYGDAALPPNAFNDTMDALHGRCTTKFTSAMLEYAEFHRAARDKLARGEFVPTFTFACADAWDCGGLADRMAGYLSTFVFALRYKRVFLSQWTAPHGFFQTPFLDVTIDPAWPDAASMNEPPTDFGMLMSCEHTDTISYAQCMFSLEDPEERYPPSQHHRIITNRGPFSVMHRHTHKNWLDDLMGREPGCLYWAMIQPTTATLEVAAPTLQRMEALRGEPLLGVHFRSGDYAMLERNNGDLDWNHEMINGTLAAIAECVYERPTLPIFVVSDSVAFRRYVMDRFPAAFSTALKPMHINAADAQREVMDFTTAMRNAFAEWYLLAQCSRTIFMLGSGFARLSHIYSVPQRQRVATDAFGPGCTAKSVYESIAFLDTSFYAGF